MKTLTAPDKLGVKRVAVRFYSPPGEWEGQVPISFTPFEHRALVWRRSFSRSWLKAAGCAPAALCRTLLLVVLLAPLSQSSGDCLYPNRSTADLLTIEFSQQVTNVKLTFANQAQSLSAWQ